MSYANMRVEVIQDILADEDVLWEVARRAIEDELIELRDEGISVVGPGNGFTVNYVDGTPGPMRMSTFDGLKVALRALMEHYALCHCGNTVAAITDHSMRETSPYMVDSFCRTCILVRCDAYPGACNGATRG